MYKHVLIATDGSELAEKAVVAGLELAKGLGAKVTAVTVSEPWPMSRTCPAAVDAYETSAAQEAMTALASAGKLARELAVECEAVHIKEHTTEGILQVAANRGCDLIVMASHGRRGVSRLILGSHATRVLTYSAIPVLICK
jgi:nucleotide-binding universal stress UspA family protein